MHDLCAASRKSGRAFRLHPQRLFLTGSRGDVEFDMVLATVEAAPASPSIAARDGLEQRGGPLGFLLRIPEVEILADGPVASWHSSGASLQSRRWHRARFERPLTVTPLDDPTERPSGPPLVVTGHDISLAGLSFVHDQPLAARKVIVTFQFDDGSSESVLTLLKWCRFRRDGLYQSGGQFLRKAAAPDAPAPSLGLCIDQAATSRLLVPAAT
jgi:hypothetical protein